ncbi:MAG: phage major capsid protein [Bacillota bacterium]
MIPKELIEKAKAAVAKARAIAQEFEGKELPAEKAAEIQRYLEEAKAAKAQADQAVQLKGLEDWLAEPQFKHPMGGGQPQTEPDRKAAQKAAFFKAFKGRGTHVLNAEEKALVENAAGEILVPEELEAEIYRELPKLTVIRDLATVRTTTSNRVRRRSLTELTVGWGKLETGAQVLADSMPGVPTEDFQYVEDLYGLALIGEDELDDTDVNLQAFVSDSFARALGETEDTAFINGTGHAANRPEGILNGAVVTRINAGQPAAITMDDMKKLIYGVPAQYRRNGSFIMASSVELAIQLLKDNNQQYLWQPSNQAGRPNTFLGFPIYNQEDVPAIPAAGVAADVAIFGDVRAAYRILDRQGMSLKVLDQLYAEDGEIGYRVKRRVGGAVVRANALRILKVPAA